MHCEWTFPHFLVHPHLEIVVRQWERSYSHTLPIFYTPKKPVVSFQLEPNPDLTLTLASGLGSGQVRKVRKGTLPRNHLPYSASKLNQSNLNVTTNDSEYQPMIVGDKPSPLWGKNKYFFANVLNNESRQSAAAKVPLCESTVRRHLGSVCHEEESKQWQWRPERSWIHSSQTSHWTEGSQGNMMAQQIKLRSE